MPTVLRIGPYRFFFFVGDRDEPAHIHIEREDKVAEFWLDSLRLQSSGGFSRNEIIRIQRVVGEYQTQLREAWNATSTIEIEVPAAENLTVTEDTLSVDLSDGRTISVPLAWYPRLTYASQSEQNNWRLVGKGYGIHWEDLDEDISVEGLLAGRPSGESQTSFKKWLASRASQVA